MVIPIIQFCGNVNVDKRCMERIQQEVLYCVQDGKPIVLPSWCELCGVIQEDGTFVPYEKKAKSGEDTNG